MRCERRVIADVAVPPRALAAEIRSLVPEPASVATVVSEILADVRTRGDAAVVELTKRFDTGGAELAGPLAIGTDELHKALEHLDPDVRGGLELAIDNVRRVAQAGMREDQTVKFGEGHIVRLRHEPVRAAAVYVPGGRAPYPSTVVMGAVTARVAGVQLLSVCSPPGSSGDVNPTVLAACALAGVDVVYRMGGAQAVAALAFGTDAVEPVDVIVGPGNLYVQEAKAQVSEQVGIDGFAGPSDLVVVAGPDEDPEPIALDLLAQAEHGPGTLVVGISTGDALLDRLEKRLLAAPETGAVALLIRTRETADAIALADELAPEHLELIGTQPEGFAASVSRAGCLFVGAAGATAFGDYIAGSNHVLPTNGAARFASGLSTQTFRRSFAEVRLSPGEATDRLARAAAPIARAEGFELHARSMEARIRENGG